MKHQVPYAGQLVGVCDGAPWIWRLVANLFPICHQIVDDYHARQHLAKMAHERYPEDEEQATARLNRMSEALFKIIAD